MAEAITSLQAYKQYYDHHTVSSINAVAVYKDNDIAFMLITGHV